MYRREELKEISVEQFSPSECVKLGPESPRTLVPLWIAEIIVNPPVSCLTNRQPGQVPQLHQLRVFGPVLLKIGQCFVERHEVGVKARERIGNQFDVDVLEHRGSLLAVLPSKMFDQDSAHRFGSRGKKVASPIPFLLLVSIDQTKIRFVNQHRRLTILACVLVEQFGRRQFLQFVVDHRKKLLHCGWIT